MQHKAKSAPANPAQQQKLAADAALADAQRKAEAEKTRLSATHLHIFAPPELAVVECLIIVLIRFTA